MVSMRKIYFILCVVATILLDNHIAFARFKYYPVVETDSDHDLDNGSDSGEGVEVSPECAVVLVTGGLIAGGTATVGTSLLFSWLLAVIGFTAEGVAVGSYAAKWQSTLPLVTAGYLFAKLQSTAMSGAGTTIMPGSIVGGAAAADMIVDICQVIDGIDPESNTGKDLTQRGMWSPMAVVRRGSM